jgi:hypothetical protein
MFRFAFEPLQNLTSSIKLPEILKTLCTNNCQIQNVSNPKEVQKNKEISNQETIRAVNCWHLNLCCNSHSTEIIFTCSARLTSFFFIWVSSDTKKHSKNITNTLRNSYLGLDFFPQNFPTQSEISIIKLPKAQYNKPLVKA